MPPAPQLDSEFCRVIISSSLAHLSLPSQVPTQWGGKTSAYNYARGTHDLGTVV